MTSVWLLLASPVVPAVAQEPRVNASAVAEIDETEFPDAGTPVASDPRRHALIVVGLPGDEAHRKQFDAVVQSWSTWLVDSLGVTPQNLEVVSGSELTSAPSAREARAEVVSEHLRRYSDELTEDDSLWIFFLGHANHDANGAFFHLPGPDLSAEQYGELLEGLSCKEQLVWLTMGSSGWFLKPLSRRGRIVVSATLTDAEPNETEFPHALSDVMSKPPETLDRDADGRLTVLEFIAEVVEHVDQRYDSDERAPTEHAQLDDNGDGRGAEIRSILKQRRDDAPIDPATRILDGEVAGETRLPMPIERDRQGTNPPHDPPEARSPNPPPPDPPPGAAGGDENQAASRRASTNDTHGPLLRGVCISWITKLMQRPSSG